MSHTKDNHFNVEVNSLLSFHVCEVEIGNFFPVNIFNRRGYKGCLIGRFIAVGYSIGALDFSGLIKVMSFTGSDSKTSCPSLIQFS